MLRVVADRRVFHASQVRMWSKVTPESHPLYGPVYTYTVLPYKQVCQTGGSIGGDINLVR